jgi:AcrR family transcriptional regulator
VNRGPAGTRSYESPLREAQAAATRSQILAAVATLIETGKEPTYSAIAEQAGMQERTVTRHFPSKDELYEAFWWMVVDARLGRTGYAASTLDEVMRDVEATFTAFDGNAALVTEMLHSKHGLAIRLRTNDQRTAMFQRVARHELPDADARTRRRAAAVTQLLYSGMAWHAMRAYWGMDAREAIASVSQALRAMFEGLRRAAPAARPRRSRRANKEK